MSYTTIQVRHICELLAGYDEIQDGSQVSTIIKKAVPKIFDFDFPFYDDTKREEWEYNFILNFYTREISAETVGLWKLWLNQKLNKIMPKYNPLYKAFADGFSAFYTMSTNESTAGNESNENTTSTTGKGTGHSQTNSNGQDDSTTKTTTKHSDTPQGSVTDLDSGLYMSDATITDNIDHTGSTSTNTLDSNSTREDTTKNKGNTDSTETKNKTGYEGRTVAEMMKEYAENMASVDLLIYADCGDLFIQYYGGVY